MPLYTNLNMRLVALPLDGAFSPTTKSTREQFKYEENQSPSVEDPLHQTEREERERAIDERVRAGTLTKAQAKKEKAKPLEVTPKTAEEVAIATDAVARLRLSRVALTDHLEERIGAFLIQIIGCYDTDLHFTVGKTETQTASAPPVAFKLTPGSSKKMPRGAAHHGTLPCIWAYPRAEWDAWKAKGDPKAPGKPAAQVYHKMSDSYLANNACSGLEKVVNDPADIHLDGNPTERTTEFCVAKPENKKKLREYSIDLLNRAARKEIDPIEGFFLYMAKLEKLVSDLADSTTKADEKAVFEAWREDLTRLRAEYNGNYKPLIARLVGVRMPRQDRDALNLEVIVFPRHFKLMQTKYTYQTHLAAKVNALQGRIRTLEKTKRQNFEPAFKVALMKEASTCDKRVRIIFQRFFNCSGASLKTLEEECEQTAKPALALVRSPAAQKEIKAFFEEFTKHVNNMGIEESHFRSDLLKEMRMIRGLSLRKFAEMFNDEFPTVHPLNYGQYYRIEGGCVTVSPLMAKRFAQILSVPEHLFLPGLLT